jgi:hypothetical protein
MAGHDRDSDSTHDPEATPVGARRGYVRTMTVAMIVLVVLVAAWAIGRAVLG